MTDGIKIDPDPPIAGQPANLTSYAGAKLLFDWDPPGLEPTEVYCDELGFAAIDIPANASSIIITDSLGQCTPLCVAVRPR